MFVWLDDALFLDRQREKAIASTPFCHFGSSPSKPAFVPRGYCSDGLGFAFVDDESMDMKKAEAHKAKTFGVHVNEYMESMEVKDSTKYEAHFAGKIFGEHVEEYMESMEVEDPTKYEAYFADKIFGKHVEKYMESLKAEEPRS